MKFNYPLVKELCKLIIDAREDIWDTRYIDKKFTKFNWNSNTNRHLSLKDFNYQLQELSNMPKIFLLNKVIDMLDELTDSKSKLADFDELISDTEYLKYYYKEKSWGDVIRWLSNINSTVRDTFSHYMDAVKSQINYNKNWKKNNK